jgi:hypothetical protein
MPQRLKATLAMLAATDRRASRDANQTTVRPTSTFLRVALEPFDKAEMRER